MNKKYVLVTGSGGLVGSESVHFYCKLGHEVIGVDNDMRAYYFGKEGSTKARVESLVKIYKNYEHYNHDIRDQEKIEDLFKKYKFNLVIHTAAQPSHDWAAKEPHTDFGVNANGTLNLLESLRKFAPEAVFIFTSTNKVYGDLPNELPLVEQKTRYEIERSHSFYNGIDETMSIDRSTHSLFGVSKAAADLLVQEYGRYFNLMTGVFRGGCLTGSGHAGTQEHGFLSYLVKSILMERKYTIFGYKGKQVRDNIHSHDLISAFHHFYQNPRSGEVYNIGGGRFANVSILEAIEKIENMSGKKPIVEYSEQNRKGDHIWYISSVEKFKNHYPTWKYEYDIDATIEDIVKNSAFSKEVFSFRITRTLDYWKEKNWYFHNSLKNIFKSIIPEGARVLQVGYGLGDILAGLFPEKGISVDTDENILHSSSHRYPHLTFLNAKPEEVNLKDKFDYVIMPNSPDHFYDIQTVLERVKKALTSSSEIIVTSLNPRWENALSLLEKMNLKREEPPKNWLRMEDLKNIVELSGYEIVESGYKIVLPLHIPLLSKLINKIFERSKLLSRFCLEQYIVAKKAKEKRKKMLSASVIIPCYNEEENIAACVERIPKMGKATEIVVVDDGSNDKTSTIIRLLQKKYRNLKLVSYKPNRGKGYAVKKGFEAATKDIVMILDADMAVPPEELKRFYGVLARNGEVLVNGTRLIYPMQEQAMRNLNLFGNLIFSWIFTWLLGTRITDTLCGTKALFKKDLKKIKLGGKSWGDFDLLFGAKEVNRKIVEMPVHYQRRMAGKSKMKAFQHGLILAKMCIVGWWRLKFLPKLR